MPEDGMADGTECLYDTDAALDKMAEVSSDLESEFESQRKKESCKGTFKPATIIDLFSGDDKELSEYETLKLKLLMPDQETVRYLSFSNPKSIEYFFESIGASKESSDVLHKTVPAIYTSEGWFLSYGDDFMKRAIRSGEYVQITYNAGPISYPTIKSMSILTLISAIIVGASFVTGLSLGLAAYIGVCLLVSTMMLPAADTQTGIFARLVPLEND